MSIHALTRRAALRTLVAATSLAALAPPAFAKTITRFYQDKTGRALKGFDATAYFATQSAKPGDTALSVNWKGATWNFATADDAARFQATPEAFAPQFGGYCTRAMSIQKEVPGDPEVWRIHNDKLYVFYAARGGKLFDKGQDAMIAAAQAHWETLSFTE